MAMIEERRAEGSRGANRNEIDFGLITIDLRAELTPEELEQFLANARAAGRTPEEHFKAITIGSAKPVRAA